VQFELTHCHLFLELTRKPYGCGDVIGLRRFITAGQQDHHLQAVLNKDVGCVDGVVSNRIQAVNLTTEPWIATAFGLAMTGLIRHCEERSDVAISG
jgi:hypothetical protein